MRQKKDFVNFLKNKGQTAEGQDPMPNSKHEVHETEELFQESNDAEYNSDDSSNTKIVSTRKWQIMVTSANCAIEKYSEGWQVR